MTSAATRSRTCLAVFVVFLASSGDLPGSLFPGTIAVASAFPMAGVAHFSLLLLHFFPSRRQPPPHAQEEEEVVSLRGPVVPLGEEDGDEEEAYNPLDDLYFTQLMQDSNYGLDKSRRYRFRVRRKRFTGEELLEEPRLLHPGEEKHEGENPEALHTEESIRMVKKALGFWLTLVHLNPERKSHTATLVGANPPVRGGQPTGSSRGVGAASSSSSSAGKGMKRRLRPIGMPMRWGR
ncbi:uncharacterized protein LOC143040316 [Oratosquilla oratoria]|uniref:uncharacterized protein LOC143040316 n=1 Tax=Oratosquilla oratoria TaxID=337810 RepID=UPI003F771194